MPPLTAMLGYGFLTSLYGAAVLFGKGTEKGEQLAIEPRKARIEGALQFLTCLFHNRRIFLNFRVDNPSK